MSKLAQAETVDCNGAAHSNPFIDNCMVCLPYWGSYPVCPTCSHTLRETQPKVWHEGAVRKGYCRTCKKHFALPEGI